MDLVSRVTEIVEGFGYLGVACLVALENLVPPIPSEVILPLGGFVAGRGDASYLGMVLAATTGSLIGAWALYFFSAWIGPVRLHALVRRFGRWFRIDEHDLHRAEAWFDRRSDVAVLIGRCIPLIRSLISVPAGFRRMPVLRFSILTIIGSAVWNASLIGAGAVLGARWEEVGAVIGLFQAVVVVALAGLVGFFAWSRFVRPALARRGQLPPTE